MEMLVNWGGDPRDENDSGMRFTARTETGHSLSMDGAPATDGGPLGGRNLAARPMELVLAGTGGCTAYDVVLILKRARQAVTGCEVRLDADRATTDPKVFTRIHFHFVLTGTALKPEVVERAIALSQDKFCSASAMLAKTATLTHSFEIRENA